MTIGGWVLCVFLTIGLALASLAVYSETDSKKIAITVMIVGTVLIFGIGFWYFNNTASGMRARTDERAELNNGLDRVVVIYTADGEVLKKYEGKIDIEQGQGYVKFDWNGKRYIYYNCYVETIADI